MRTYRITDFPPIEPARNPDRPHAYRLKDCEMMWDAGRKGSSWKLIIDPSIEFDYSVPAFLVWLKYTPFIGRLFDRHDKRNLLPAAIHDVLVKEMFDIPFSSAEMGRASRAVGNGWFIAACQHLATLLWLGFKSWFVSRDA